MDHVRLNRLFDAASGRLLDVAVDHGLFGEPSFIAGIEDMSQVVQTLVDAAPDAIQLSIGHAGLLQSVRGSSVRRWSCAPTWRMSTGTRSIAMSSVTTSPTPLKPP
ncbi:hypothetical protein [Agromyces marinus]|uniref:hypothetical protein n=1 Tax=Agromyces marinus TaxID=1389020 RepID=UPI002573CACE|nr:hypothetical protein [Agromyces marinus]